MLTPKVSIIMATYNREKFIVESLIAIQNQTYSSWECLIIDDGGTDNTAAVITPVLENDQRFFYTKRTEKYQKGLPGSRNYGLDLAKGDYIIFFDDDDIPHPQNLEICVSELEKRDISFCRYIREVFTTSDFHYNFNYSKNYTFFNIDYKDVEKMLDNTLQFNSCAVMWKRECFDENRYVEHLKYLEEWELYSRIVSSGFGGISIDKTLFYGRKHVQSMTGDFYNKDTSRQKSYADAVVLAVKNLKEKHLLSHYIIRYFIVISFNFKEFNLFKRILKALDLSLVKRVLWQLFYKSLYIRLPIYRIKASYKRKKQDKA